MAALYFFYGLSFFVLGLVLLIRDVPVSLRGLRLPLRLFGLFGLLHAINEWLVMAKFSTLPETIPALAPLISFFGGFSFLILLYSGYSFIVPNHLRTNRIYTIPLILSSLLWGGAYLGSLQGIWSFDSADLISRWVLGAPGAFLTGLGLIAIGTKTALTFPHARAFNKTIKLSSWRFKTALNVAGGATIVYGLSTFLGPHMDFVPASFINEENFTRLFGIPVQGPRMALAFILALMMILWPRSLQHIELEEMEMAIEARTKELSILNENLNHALKSAEKANKAKSDFLASMSHELRTPLNAILGFAQLIKIDYKNPLSKRQDESISHIVEGGQHLLELVNDILDLARIEADRIDFSVDEINAAPIIQDCLSLIEPLGQEKDIHWEIPNLNAQSIDIRTDRVRFKQILINLLSNAVKYNKQGGAIRIALDITSSEFLKVSVVDTGPGIPYEKLSDVFNMFQRLESNPMISQEGTGIGLTVSKLLIDRLGGRIGVESAIGKGSTFWFELPLAANDEIIIWDDSYSIGIDRIDKDHQNLILLLNKTVHKSLPKTEINDIILDLIRYTQYHFSREEALMESINYPALADHREQHRRFILKVEKMAGKWFSQQNAETLAELRRLLKKWLIEHICKSDSEIGAFIQSTEDEKPPLLALEESGNLSA